MARLIIASLLVILPIVLAGSESGRAVPFLGQREVAGAGVGSFGHVSSQQEEHDKKNIGLNVNLDKGSSSSYSGTVGQVGVAGAGSTRPGYPVVGGSYPPVQQYPYQPYPYPYYGYPYTPYTPYTPQVPPYNPNYYGPTASAHIPGGVGAVAGSNQPVVPRY